MKLEILGCSGGVAPGFGTTAFRVDQDILIDAGTGVERLPSDAYDAIKHVFLSHSHLDHVCHLPFLLNNIIGHFQQPVTVYGLPETIQALKTHIFNNVIWPDFTRLPTPEMPCLVLKEVNMGEQVSLNDRVVTFLPAKHTVPAAGFHVMSQGKGFAFTGDSAANDAFWQALNRLPQVHTLIVDDQYLSREKHISQAALHYYSASLKSDLKKLNYHPQLRLTHLPPTRWEDVLVEAQQEMPDWDPQPLKPGQTLVF